MRPFSLLVVVSCRRRAGDPAYQAPGLLTLETQLTACFARRLLMDGTYFTRTVFAHWVRPLG